MSHGAFHKLQREQVQRERRQDKEARRRQLKAVTLMV